MEEILGQETRNEEVSTEGSQDGDGSMKPRPRRNANGLGGMGEEAGSSGMSGVGTPGTVAEWL